MKTFGENCAQGNKNIFFRNYVTDIIHELFGGVEVMYRKVVTHVLAGLEGLASALYLDYKMRKHYWNQSVIGLDNLQLVEWVSESNNDIEKDIFVKLSIYGSGEKYLEN